MKGIVFQYNGSDAYVATATKNSVNILVTSGSFYCVQEDNTMLLGFTKCRPTIKQFDELMKASRFIDNMEVQAYKNFYQESLVQQHGGGVEDHSFVSRNSVASSKSKTDILGALGVRIGR